MADNDLYEVEIDFIFYYILLHFYQILIESVFLAKNYLIDLFMIQMPRNRFNFIIFLLVSSKLRMIQKTNQSIVKIQFKPHIAKLMILFIYTVICNGTEMCKSRQCRPKVHQPRKRKCFVLKAFAATE